jgi:hypothetical protein
MRQHRPGKNDLERKAPIEPFLGRKPRPVKGFFYEIMQNIELDLVTD